MDDHANRRKLMQAIKGAVIGMIGHLAGAVPRPAGPAPYRRDNWRSEEGGELRRARQLGRPMTSQGLPRR